MDIQSTGDNLLTSTLQNLQKSQNELLIHIARLAGLTANNSGKAQVIDTKNLSPEDREKLLAQIDKSLSQIKMPANTLAAQQQLEALEQQKKLLQSSLVKLVLLQINNKSVVVYSNQDLQKGQEINLKLIPNIGLQLVDLPDTDSIESIKLKFEQIVSQNLRQLLPLQKSDNFFTALASISQLSKLLPPSQLNLLIDKPIQLVLDRINQLIPNLDKIIDPQILKVIIEKSGIQFERQLIQSLTNGQLPTGRESLVKSSIENQQASNTKSDLDRMQPVQATFTPGQRLSPQNLAPLLANVNLIKSNSTNTNNVITNPSNNPVSQASSLLGKKLDNIAIQASVVTNSNNSTASTSEAKLTSSTTNSSSINPTKIINAANLQTLNQSTRVNNAQIKNTMLVNSPGSPQKQQDLKGALVELVSKTQTAIEADEKLPGLNPILPNTHLKDFIAQLLPMFADKMQQKELSIKVLRTQLVALLQQHAYQAVSKIQIQQLNSLQPQTNAQTSESSQQTWQMEIPIRYQQDIHPMQLHIEKRIVEDKESDNQSQREKIKQWKIMMNFELPVVGHFYAQLIWLNQQLSATLWAEKSETLVLAKEKMENLRAKLQQEGIIVTQLECLSGAPNRPQNQVNYSLIDITT